MSLRAAGEIQSLHGSSESIYNYIDVANGGLDNIIKNGKRGNAVAVMGSARGHM